MQSHQSSFGAKQSGHRRRPSMGKAMPVTDLLLSFPPPSVSAMHSRHSRDGRSPDDERPPMYFHLGDQTATTTKGAKGEDTATTDDQNPARIEEASDDGTDLNLDYALLVSDCSSGDGSDDESAVKISLSGNSNYKPCLTCTGSAPAELAMRPLAINEMCRKLCTDDCRLRLSLAGYVPASEAALQSRKDLEDLMVAPVRFVGENSQSDQVANHDGADATAHNPIAVQRKKFLSDILTNLELADVNIPDDADRIEVPPTSPPPGDGQTGEGTGDKRVVVVDESDVELLKDLRERSEIAEALAKTSAMTSTSRIKQRLAARKLEIELENPNATVDTTADDDTAGRRCMDEGASTSAASVDGELPTGAAIADALLHIRSEFADEAAAHNGSNYEPPRELLLYLVRMGSFNSAPKIHNSDSQDDGLEIPKGLSTNELLQHVKHLRGENQPPLLSRYFLRPLDTNQAVSNDITDGLRYLKLGSLSRVCSAPLSAPNHIRLLQWNILSQTLGQNNDGFVRCPEEALTWESRKFLIVQEILQTNPDIICLQEVDHYKFLQNILGSQNYDGIFFPKPDSPCLYIEENNGPDGCAIFYKREKFELINFDTRILEVWRVQSNQVAIAANLRVKSTGKDICVCTTHLKARHGSLLAKLRNEQGRDLIRFVKQFAGEQPIILCGDFNAEPVEPVYSTILNCDILKLSSAYADIREEVEKCNGNAKDKELVEECDKIESSIKREPPYTTWKIREDGEVCHTIDYVFYSKDCMKVKNCLEFPQADEIGKNRTPSFQYPSDHFSLVCDFELLDQE